MAFINNNLLTQAHQESAYETAYQDDVLNRYISIQDNHRHSIFTLHQKVMDLLTSQLDARLQECTSVVVFGSYARLDASRQSDFDNLVLTTSERETSAKEVSNVLNRILADLSIPLPNPNGVFSGGVYAVSGIEDGIGGVKDDYKCMSRRLLLLLESRPIFGVGVHNSVVENLVTLYGRDVGDDPRKNYVFLLNDLIRYFRTICVNYHHTMETETDHWPVRNIKLRHSRLVMYASLVAMLGVLSTYREKDKNDRLREFIRLTPLQRLHRAYLEVGDTGFYKVAGSYDVFLCFMNDPEARASLKSLPYAQRYKSRDFAVLKANSDALASELSRFFLDRRGLWSDRFYEYLLM
ncbi:MAG: nucleotidyltransferase domain-containing protein [Gammaproteobacteria bacterium]